MTAGTAAGTDLPRRDGPFAPITRYRNLTYAMTQRDVLGRYRGASFGLLWSLVSPFLMLIIYTLAFGYILKARWPGHAGDTSEFALILYLGLIVHGMFAECLTRSPQLIVQNANLVTRVVFPLPVLPWSIVLSAAFHMLANTLIYIALSFLIRGFVPLQAFLLPLVWLPLLVLGLGVSLALSAAGVFLRDINQVMGVLATAMLFLSSAIVPIDSVPEGYRWIFEANPLTFIIDQCRNVAFFGVPPDIGGLALYLAGAMAVLVLANRAFNKASSGFADVL